MEHRISILFYVRKSKMTKDNLSPIYIRITVNGQRLDHSIQRYVDAVRWSAAAGRVKGNNEEARLINQYLDTFTGKVLKLEREMVQDGQTIDFENFRTKWLGITERPRMLIEVFQQYNDQMGALAGIGRQFSPATLERYNLIQKMESKRYIKEIKQLRENVRRLRLRKKLTQFALEALTGIDRGDISRIENGHMDIQFSGTVKLAEGLEVL